MRYTTVLFDLDGTLLDTSKGILNSVRDTIAFYALPSLNDRDLLVFLGCSIYESFKKFYPEQDASKLVAYFRKMYAERHFEEAGEYDGISDVLKQLQNAGIRIGVATFKREDLAHKLLSKYVFARYINTIYGSDSEGKLSKSNIIANCIKSIHFEEKKKVLMVGDAENDANAASSVGVDFIGVSYGYGFDENVFKDFPVARTPQELLELIRLS